MRIDSIPLSKIDHHDTTYLISTKSDCQDLTQSIATAGLINPPILAGRIIICGFRRIASMQTLKYKEIRVQVLPVDTPALTCVKLAIADNMQRSLNAVELGRALTLLSDLIQNQDTFLKTAALLGLPSHRTHINKLLQINQLPLFISKLLPEEIISQQTALEISTWGYEAAQAIINIILDLHPGQNIQREIITMLKEIAVREDLKMIDLLQFSQFTKILENSELKRSQKIEKLRTALKSRRFPVISAHQDRFATLKKKLNRGGLQLQAPYNFEAQNFTCSIQFKTLEELKTGRDHLTHILHDPDFKKFL